MKVMNDLHGGFRRSSWDVFVSEETLMWQLQHPVIFVFKDSVLFSRDLVKVQSHRRERDIANYASVFTPSLANIKEF